MSTEPAVACHMSHVTGSGVYEMSSTYSGDGPAFDYDDADITLRSSDQVDYHVHKIILSTSSPFFKSMFSLPQTDATVSVNQNPIIDLPENNKTIGALLTRIYPTPIPGGPEVTVSVVPLNQEPGAIFPTAGVCSITTKSPTVVWEVPARLRPEKGSS